MFLKMGKVVNNVNMQKRAENQECEESRGSLGSFNQWRSCRVSY